LIKFLLTLNLSRAREALVLKKAIMEYPSTPILRMDRQIGLLSSPHLSPVSVLLGIPRTTPLVLLSTKISDLARPIPIKRDCSSLHKIPHWMM
jgi:hypothetical protein